MKILQVITGLKKAAGTSTFCGELGNQLVALGHEVTIAIVNPHEDNLYPLDPRIHLISIADLFVGSAPAPYTLIHIHGLWSPILHKVAKWARQSGLPIVWSTHGMTAPWALHHKWWKKCLPWHLYQRRDLAEARLIHCTSDFEVAWNHNLGFTRTLLAPLGTFLPRTDIGVEPAPSTAAKTLLFVGRVYPVKALDRLIEAFGKAKQSGEGEQWTLRIVGPDQAGHTAELKQMCERLDVSSYVHFAGSKYGDDLEREYDNCTALALVSHTENFGATVVDALAHGKPVITSTKTPWQIVADNACGWWVDNDVDTLSAALRQLFRLSAAELTCMGANGHRLVAEKYTWQAVVKAMLSGYNQLPTTNDQLPTTFYAHDKRTVG